jgi:hypothetical protein
MLALFFTVLGMPIVRSATANAGTVSALIPRSAPTRIALETPMLFSSLLSATTSPASATTLM